MYCSSCGATAADGLKYCKHCGEKLPVMKGDDVVQPSEIKPETLINGIMAVFICGLGAIAVLIGVMKRVVGFDLPIILAVIIFSFVMMTVVEAVLIGLLLKGRRSAGETRSAELPKERTTNELEAGQGLLEPVPSVTELTTRTFEPIYSRRESK